MLTLAVGFFLFFIHPADPLKEYFERGLVSALAGTTYSDNMDNQGVRKRVVQYFIHENYTEREWLYDIAILVLESKYERQMNLRTRRWTIYWICPPPDDFPAREVTVPGWGQTVPDIINATAVQRLQHVKLDVLGESECDAFLRSTNRRYDPKIQFCATREGKDTCAGDSGSPAVTWNDGHPVVYGLVSYGPKRCAAPVC